MITIKEFEQQKLKIMTKMVVVFNNETNHRAIESKVAMLDMIKYLEPPKPSTCETCTKEETSCNIVFTIGINKIKGFGCTLHSDYEEENYNEE